MARLLLPSGDSTDSASAPQLDAAGDAVAVEVASLGPPPVDTASFDPHAAPSRASERPRSGTGTCTMHLTADRLSLLLRNGATGFSGADYPHAYPLPDGRVLWLFQDVFVGVGQTLDEARFAHHGGVVQDGSCLTPLPGSTGADPHSWLAPEREVPGRHWFWPLDGELGADGALWVFFAEMHNPNGTGAAMGALPVGTWTARVDPYTLQVLSFVPATDRSVALHGWSIASDDRFSYLFGHCYRQFVPDSLLGVDACSAWTTLARVPVGRFGEPPEYFDGIGWSPDPSAAVPVLRGGMVHGSSVQRLGDRWVAVTKEDDWFGDELVVQVAARPEGPWHDVARHRVEPSCQRCNTYGAFLLPWLEDGRLVVAMSANAWEMHRHALDNASMYRPFVITLPWPSD